jgi:hypothetical protein
LCYQHGARPILARHSDFGETYRKSVNGRLDVAENGRKTVFYDVNHKMGRRPLVTLVTDLVAVRRETSSGNLRSSPAINRFVRFCLRRRWLRRQR